MEFLIFLAVSFYLIFSASVQATPTFISKKDPGYLQVPIRKIANPYRDTLHRRGLTEISLKHESSLYYALELKVGTPAQKVSVVLDTGSSDLWLSSSENPFCFESGSSTISSNHTYNGAAVIPSIDCEASGTFDFNASSSLDPLDIGRFFINYSDGSFADGFWANEKMFMGEINLSSLQFAVAEYATAPVGGVLGISFPRRESVRGYEGAPDRYYPNFPQLLKNEGVIDVVAYSLFLNERNSEAGSILLGAVDTNKYIGDLYTFPMVNEFPQVVDKPATVATTLQGIGAIRSKNCQSKTFSTTKLPVLLDSGTTLISAPEEVAEEMASFANATFSESHGIYVLKCPTDDDDTEFVFDFGDLKITVPLSSLILLPPENGLCGFGVIPTSDTMTLGDVFLSSAYVVYDLDNYQISLAQANWDHNPLESSNVKIPKNGKILGAKEASATPWTTNEPIAVDHDIFENYPSFCVGFQNQTTSPVAETSRRSDVETPANITSRAMPTTTSHSSSTHLGSSGHQSANDESSNDEHEGIASTLSISTELGLTDTLEQSIQGYYKTITNILTTTVTHTATVCSFTG